MSGYLEKMENGWIMYCGNCMRYIKQSDPQNFSGGKTVVIDTDQDDCEDCKARAQEVLEAQSLMGRLGLPKGDLNEE